MQKNKIAFVAFCLSLWGIVTPASCDEDWRGSSGAYSIGPAIGTLGAGIQLTFWLRETLVLRGDVSILDFNVNDFAAGVGGHVQEDYDLQAEGVFAGILLDWHPFASGWRFTGGVRYVNLELSEEDHDGKRIGVTDYSSADVGTIRTVVSNSAPAAPYFGFGFDHTYFTRGGTSFSLAVDLGALYAGTPDVKISTDTPAPGLDADIVTETNNVKEDLNAYYRFYPVIMLSGKFRF